MKVVLDTNVFISGIFWSGNYCSQLINKWKNKELVETLKSFKVSMSDGVIEEWKTLILKNSILVESLSKIEAIKDDPDDNKFLEVAVDGKAELIVSQDRHLLNLKEYNEIKIVKPEEAVNLI